MKKIKKVLALSMAVAVAVNSQLLTAKCDNSLLDVQSAEETVREYYDSIGMEWENIPELHIASQREIYEEFYNNKDNKEGHVGIFNVKSAEIVEIEEIEYEDAVGMMNEEYNEDNSLFFVVGVNYNVYEENEFYSCGIKYGIISLIKENEEWRIYENIGICNPQKLMDAGYDFDDEYETTIDMANARNAGILINGYGEEYGKLYDDATYADSSDSGVEVVSATREKAKNGYIIPDASSRFYLGVYKDGKYTGKKTVQFEDYCLAVTAGEVRQKDMDGNARRACCVAIKTYTWFYIINPQSPELGYNISTTRQSYRPDKVDENPDIYVDYELVKNMWMESYDGRIFEAKYKAGTESADYKHCGELKQNGCKYLAGKGYTWSRMLHYYYDTDNTQIFIFNQNKLAVFK